MPSGTNRGTSPVVPRRRLLWIVVVGLASAAALLWGAGQLAWDWQVRAVPGGGSVPRETSGAVLHPSLTPLALLALAAIAAAVATGGWPRRIVGVLVALCGLVALWLGLGSFGAVFAAHPPGYPTLTTAFGRLLAALAGLVLVGCGAVLVRAAQSLPRLGAAYQAPGAERRPVDPDRRMWEALSDGEDPTVGR